MTHDFNSQSTVNSAAPSVALDNVTVKDLAASLPEQYYSIRKDGISTGNIRLYFYFPSKIVLTFAHVIE